MDRVSAPEPVDLDSLERLAKAATPGKRTLNGDAICPVEWGDARHAGDVAIAYRNCEREDYDQVTADLVMLAALDPATVQHLLSLARRAQEAERLLSEAAGMLDEVGGHKRIVERFRAFLESKP